MAFATLFLALGLGAAGAQPVRIKDIADFEGVRDSAWASTRGTTRRSWIPATSPP